MSDASEFRRLEDVFREALRLEGDARRAYLDERCAGDAGLRAEVEALLREDEETRAGALDRPALGGVDLQGILESGGAREIPERIGGYRIVARVGEGGMGVVFEAEQENPRRRVALKVMAAAFASTSAQRRFELEAQVLGRLQHPGIAQIHEAGVAMLGGRPTPFFAMEFVDGGTLTAYAEAARLSTEARLRLLADVCDAVHHAHQRGVIHRDLKPGNILVDAAGQPKVLDFGVARLTDADVEVTSRTDMGQLLGTLGYMSPEQASGKPDDIDTRTDVYALGVIAYELLAGRLPLETRGRLVHEVVRMIREDEPASLSSVSRVLSGDIDTIVRKAMEKDRGRRYDSAAALAADIRRYLSDQPITARAPSAMYQLRKFTRRNRGLVAAALVGVLMLAAGAAVSATFAVRESIARRDAERLAQLESEARGEAERQRMLAESEQSKYVAVSDFFGGVIRKANPDKTAGEELTVREALELAAEELSDDAQMPWDVQAFLRYTVGDTLLWMGRGEEAIPHLERSLELRREHLPELHEDVVWSLVRLGNAWTRRGRPEASVELLAGPIERLRELNASGGRQADLAELLRVQARALLDLQRPDEAAVLVDEAMGLYEAVGEAGGPVADLLNSLAGIWMREARFDEAERAYRRALEIYAAEHGENSAYWSITLNNLALMLRRAHRMEEAEAAYRRVLEVDEALAGGRESTPNLCMTTMNLGSLLSEERRLDEAVEMLRRSVAYHEALYKGEHQYQAFAMNQLATALSLREEWDEAASLLAGAREILEAQLGPRHPNLAVMINSRANVLMRQGRHEEAVEQYREALAIMEESLGPEHPWTLDVALAMCRSLRFIDEEQTLERLEALMPVLEKDPERDRLAAALHTQAVTLTALARYGEAAARLERAVAIREEMGLGDHWETVSMRLDLGSCRLRTESGAESGIELIMRSCEELVSILGAGDVKLVSAVSAAASLLERQGRAEEADKLRGRMRQLGVEMSEPEGVPAQ